MSARDAAERFAKGTGRKIPAPPFRHERAAEEAPPRPRRAAPEEEEKAYYDERIAPMTTQTAPRSSIANFLVGLMALAMIVAFGLFIAGQFGYSPAAAPHAPSIPPPTPIIRMVAPQPAIQSMPVEQPARPPVEQPVPQPAPALAPAPAEQPAPATRQIIIVKNGNDPGAAPIVIDRGTKRRSP